MVDISPPPHRIYLLRHAEAGWAQPGERDFDRSLNENGYAEAELVADRAADKGYRPEVVISSTAVRCRQTADAVRRAIGSSVDFRFVDELYNAPVDVYLEIVQSQGTPESIMLIGHNPTMEHALEALIGHEALSGALPNGFPTGGLAVVEYVDGSAGTGWVLADLIVE